jgi:hypothetical protein
MANSLHYVKEKDLFVGEVQTRLKNEGCFIIVEYDTEISNPWIPFPVSYNSLKKLFEKEGYQLFYFLLSRISTNSPFKFFCSAILRISSVVPL